MIKTEADVRALLAVCDAEYETTADMDPEAEAVYETLLWFVGDRTNEDVRAYLTD